MERSVSREALSQKAGTVRIFPERKKWLPPWLFGNQGLMLGLEKARKVSKEGLVNAINHIHFTSGYVYILLNCNSHNESLLLKAFPEPCLGSTLTCHWDDEQFAGLELQKVMFSHLIIDDQRFMIMVPGVLKEINQESLSIELPEVSYAVGQRKAKRYVSHEVGAELVQSGFHAKGYLVDFSPTGFKLSLTPDANCSFRWFNSEEKATVHLRHGQKMVYSGTCSYVRQRGNSSDKEIVLAPGEEKIKRFKNKRIRNVRQRLVPSPHIVFFHPLLGKKVQMEVGNISTSGFSVYEDQDERVLLPGMIIPELSIRFADVVNMKCSAQVIYCAEEEGKRLRCGIAILDMDIDSYSRLTQILTSSLDPHAYISSEVDMDALWEFFFQAGFIYPKKYRLIHSERESFKETYHKLYLEHPEVARHFTYQRNGRIFGHISMVRAYERAWMIHHHAAQAMDNKRTGFAVLKQMMHYLNDMYRLPSAHMDYVMCYFRPENKFPDRVFGGFARELNDPRGCSMDLFAYLPYTSLSLGTTLPEGWSLSESSEMDLWEFNRFYRHASGGLLLDALSVGPEGDGRSSLEEVYGGLGLLRKWKVYSLCYRGEAHALLIANKSSLGFNLSELLNGIKVLVMNPKGVPWSVLSTAISQLAAEYQTPKIPILFYPTSYVESNGIPFEKHYQLWILNVQYGNDYLDYMQRRFRIVYT